ncbi:MAG: phosphotransferase [Saprospiraceae bacterium]
MLPKQEIEINETIVNQLIVEQFPQLSHLPISFLGSGWDNMNYRLGTKYIIRIPRRKIAVKLLENEINWLPKIKSQLPIPISAAVFIGKPNEQIPWNWAITPWFDGTTSDVKNLEATEAIRLANFLKKLHQLPTENMPHNAFRAVPVGQKIDEMQDRLNYLKVNTKYMTSKVQQLLETAINEKDIATDSFIHGDLHPFNIIQQDGKIQVIADWGDMTNGNPATDLAAFWMLFKDKSVRDAALQTYQATQRQINMAIGWAIFYGSFFLYEGMTQPNEAFENLGKFVLRNLNEEK